MREIRNRENLQHIVSVLYDAPLGAAWQQNRKKLCVEDAQWRASGSLLLLLDLLPRSRTMTAIQTIRGVTCYALSRRQQEDLCLSVVCARCPCPCRFSHPSLPL